MLGRLDVVLAAAAVAMEIGAFVVLSIPEQLSPTGASIWSWYWPLANTLYFGGILCVLAAIVWTIELLLMRVGADQGTASAVTVALSVLSVIVNRLAPYR